MMPIPTSILLAACLAAGAADPAVVAPDHAAIRYLGRWQAQEGERVGQWAAPALRVAFTGTRLAIRLGQEPSSFVVRVDDGPDRSFADRRGTVEIAPEGLGGGAHRLRIVAACGKALRFRGLELAPGGTVLAPAPAPTLLFIGDSITFGAGATDPTLGGWAWLASEALGADCVRIAQGGIGLCDGFEAPLGTRGMERQFAKLGAVGSPLAEREWTGAEDPAVVVVNLGTNDGNRNHAKPVPMDVFRARYAGFLKTLRTRYPKPPILALELFNSYASEKCAAIRGAVEDYAKASGDARVHCVSAKGWVNPDPKGGDIKPDWSHPTDQGHAKLAAKAAEAIRPHLQRP